MMVNVAIVGCGLVGARWDMAPLLKERSLSHASAFSKNKEASIVAFCDCDYGRALEAGMGWGCANTYQNAHEMFDRLRIDLVVIATPPQHISEIVDIALNVGVRNFLLEKPAATSYNEVQCLIKKFSNFNALALINYSRRWSSPIRSLKNQLTDGSFGGVQRMVGYYGKGLLNNGSHMIDLAIFLLDLTEVYVVSAKKNKNTGLVDGIDVNLEGKKLGGMNMQIDLISTDSDKFTIFEAHLIMDKGIIFLENMGGNISIRKIISDPLYEGYKILDVPRAMEISSPAPMDIIAQESIDLAIGRTKTPTYNLNDAGIVLKVIERAVTIATQ